MSRYKVSQYIGLTPLVYDVTGPGNQVIATIWSSNEDEVAHLVRYIEAHDEIVAVLRQIAEANGKWLVLEACTDKLTSIINRLDGKEAE